MVTKFVIASQLGLCVSILCELIAQVCDVVTKFVVASQLGLCVTLLKEVVNGSQHIVITSQEL